MLSFNKKYLIVIAGPTAVGKTAVAIQLAKYFDTQIISADSRQLFKELNIGVARPSEEELSEVKHHFIANKSITENVSAGEYEREVLALLEQLYQEKDVVVLCGGTGFYINAVLYGFDDIPPVDPAVRVLLNQRYKENGIEPLQQQLSELDMETFRSMDIQNPQRVIRALEVCIGTGKKFSAFKNKNGILRTFNPVKIGLMVSKEELHHNINIRVDEMMCQGLLEEAKSVYRYKNHNALQTVGYKELFDFIDGKTTQDEAVELIKLHTRQYAKRQLTFFNKHKDYTWFEPAQFRQMIDFIDRVIK